MRFASIEARTVASLYAFGRVGFIVPRYKHSAVDRNLLKRRLREIVRLELLPTLGARDVVIRALPQAYRREYDSLKREILQLKNGIVGSCDTRDTRDQ